MRRPWIVCTTGADTRSAIAAPEARVVVHYVERHRVRGSQVDLLRRLGDRSARGSTRRSHPDAKRPGNVRTCAAEREPGWRTGHLVATLDQTPRTKIDHRLDPAIARRRDCDRGGAAPRSAACGVRLRSVSPGSGRPGTRLPSTLCPPPAGSGWSSGCGSAAAARVRITPGRVEASADPPLTAPNPAGERVELTSTSQTFKLPPSHQGRSL